MLEFINRYAESFISAFKLHDISPDDMIKESSVAAQYKRKQSFTDSLPFIEYLPEQKMFLFEDCVSVAAGFEFRTRNVEGFPPQSKASIRDQVMYALGDSIPQAADNPWVVEVFFSNTYSLDETISKICEFRHSGVPDNDPLKAAYNKLYDYHLTGIAGEKGIFTDTQVTDTKFSGKETHGRLIVYRRSNKKRNPGDEGAIEELEVVRDKVEQAFSKLHMDLSVLTGKKYYDWMFRWFNPKPDVTDGNVENALKMFPYPGDDDALPGRDFSGMMSLSVPQSDTANGTWKFDDIHHKYLSVETVRRKPKMGVFSAPIEGKTLFDSMPAGAMFAMKIVFVDKDSVEADIARIEKKSVGDGAVAREAKDEAATANDILVRGGTLLPIEMGFYIKGEDDLAIRKVKNEVISIASEANLQIITDKYDKYACDSYLKMMPGNYRWKQNAERNRSIKLSIQHVANYFPAMGRGRGTGTPVQVQFNRGGEPMNYDVISDRNANSHAVMIGSTGAGKSAKMVEKVYSYAAQYNARIFIIEKGESFKLMMEYLASYGRKTHSIKLTRSSGAVIPPYANAYKALAAEEADIEEAINTGVDTVQAEYENIKNLPEASVPDSEDLAGSIEGMQLGEDDDLEKDYLGEMELITRIIVTGGNSKLNETITPAQQSFIRRALLNAAKRCRDEGKPHPLVSDVAFEFKRLAETDGQMQTEHKAKVYEMGEAMNSFTLGLAGKLFNKYGELWPEADVTHIDLGDVTRDGKSAELAVAYASILNSINDIAEREQYSGRPIIVLTDEGHNIVSKSSKASAILVPAVVKIVKMWRKLNAWYWIATQNVGDFSDEAAAILKLCEWWEVLTVESGEDEEIARFKRLTEEQSNILASVTKENRKYTEGFVMCRNKRLNNQIFRNIPPSLVLALAMSDPEEKAWRAKIMKEQGVTEAQAVDVIAAELDKSRGFVKAT